MGGRPKYRVLEEVHEKGDDSDDIATESSLQYVSSASARLGNDMPIWLQIQAAYLLAAKIVS